MRVRLIVTTTPVLALGPTVTTTGLTTLPPAVRTPVIPEVCENCEECGAELVPLIGATFTEVRAMFCEYCEFGV
ncbi:hypothetical protein OG763_14595 [Streptomyces sp. NBC_01230]|uniref:hypothetical protein n=1 Tax=Streptomyces sp. NBC_01230 TaxID=2903784 RepID=UPI002E0D99D5|nr:hypothetical protein OG763_14595 [Streptomyces sp. NBC_01230]